MEYQENLDFEIAFYENLLKKLPRFINAYIALAEAYTRKGRYEDGLRIDRKLARLKPNDPLIMYNLACSYSLLKMADPCIQALRRAIKTGYKDFAFMERDKDLAFIREDPRFRKLLSEGTPAQGQGVSI